MLAVELDGNPRSATQDLSSTKKDCEFVSLDVDLDASGRTRDHVIQANRIYRYGSAWANAAKVVPVPRLEPQPSQGVSATLCTSTTRLCTACLARRAAVDGFASNACTSPPGATSGAAVIDHR